MAGLSDTKSGFKMSFILESAQADFDCIAAVSTAKLSAL
jgi:hypothetical protein